MTYIDLVLLAVIGLIVYISVKNGFFKTLFNLIAYVAAVVAAKAVSPILSEKAFDSFIRDGAERYLGEVLSGVTTEQLPEQATQVMNSVPDKLRGLLEVIGFTEEKISEEIATIEFDGQDVVSGIMDKIVEPIGIAIMQFLIFIVLGIVFLIAAKIIVKLFDGVIKRLPIIKGLNSILGGVLGFVRGCVIAAVLAGVLGIVASLSDNQGFIDAVSGSFILNSLTEVIGDFSF